METLTLPGSGFDSLLGLLLLWLAWRALSCTDLFKGIVLFIAFGLLMALAWVRLDAPDVALAEAAIGAGLTGALLLAALAKLRSTVTDHETAKPDNNAKLKPMLPQWLPLIALLLVAAGVVYAAWSLPPHAEGLGAEIAANLARSGVENPVTAVLLNFRGYDTLLEMVVLLLALLGVWSIADAPQPRATTPGCVLDTLSRLLVPVLILVAAYLLWVGAHAPGGAFQAGSVLGATGVLLLLSGWRLHSALLALPLRLILVAGPAAFVAMAVVTLLMGGELLEYRPQHAGTMILILETAATISIAATLAALFLGGRPQPGESE